MRGRRHRHNHRTQQCLNPQNEIELGPVGQEPDWHMQRDALSLLLTGFNDMALMSEEVLSIPIPVLILIISLFSLICVKLLQDGTNAGQDT